MKTAHEIVSNYIAENEIDMSDFWDWFHDARYSQDEANIHDSRFLAHLETYVTEREQEEG